MDDKITLRDMMLGDPLRDITRKERRNLIGVASIGLLVAKAGIIPSKITALGLDFDQADKTTLQFALGLGVAYFLCAFVVYGFADFLAWRFRLLEVIAATAKADAQSDLEPKKSGPEFTEKIVRERLERIFLFQAPFMKKLMPFMAKAVTFGRIILDFVAPTAFGLYACLALFCKL
jgi:hypothetical protein